MTAITSNDWKSRNTVLVSKQYFHCFGLIVVLRVTVLVLCLETKIVQDIS